MSLAARQKSLVQPVHSNLHVTTRNTRFYPLLRLLLLQRNFGIKKKTHPTKASQHDFWQPASMSIWSKM